MREDDVWKNVGANLSQQPIKASALELPRLGSEFQRGTTIALPAALEQAERRDHVGQNRLAVRDRIEELRAEMSLDPAVVEARALSA